MGTLDEWTVSVVCETFGCMPAEAIEAIENDIGGLLFTIMDLRAYRATKEAVDRAKTQADQPTGYVADLVREHTGKIAKELIERRRARAERR